jgi:predicted nucleotidyltransferase
MKMIENVNAYLAQLEGVVANIQRNLIGDAAIILIGSAARGCCAEASDIDLLVIAEIYPNVDKNVPGYHIQCVAEEDFVRNLLAGEDFEGWCVRYGVPLYDAGIWARITATPAAKTWPSWKVKVVHGARRLFLANVLLETGDTNAATEETIYVLGHAARGILLKEGIFPLSRPELATQVSDVGYPHLAAIHERLRGGDDVPTSLIKVAQFYSKKLLYRLDPQTYQACSEDFRRKKIARDAKQRKG